MKKTTVKVGDKVIWRGGFGGDAPRTVTVTGLDVTEYPREKYGESVEEVSWDLVQLNRVLFSLDTGNWAYSEQIDGVVA